MTVEEVDTMVWRSGTSCGFCACHLNRKISDTIPHAGTMRWLVSGGEIGILCPSADHFWMIPLGRHKVGEWP